MVETTENPADKLATENPADKETTENPADKKTNENPADKETTEKSADNHDGLHGWKLLRQVFVGVMVSMITVSSSANSAAAVMLPQLMSNSSDIPLTMQQGIWFASAHTLSAAVGSSVGGMAVHQLGPRRVLLLQALPTIAGWLLMALAINYPMLVAGRSLVGCCCGLSLSAGQVYMGESASPQIRGRLVCMNGMFNNLGSVLFYVSGYVLPWRWIPVAPVLLFLAPSTLGMLFVPESPYWLLGRQQHQHARRSLRSLRGDHAVAERDLQIISEACQARQKPLTMRELAAEMRKLSVLAPFLTITVLFILRVMAGIMTVLTYTVEIFQEAGSALDAYQSSIVLGCVRTFNAVCCVLYVSDRFGRRTLLMFSGVGCSATCLGLAAFLFARDQTPLWPGWRHVSWLPLPLILLYIIAFDYGFARTGWVVHAEILPNRVRSALSGFGVLIHFVASFVAVFSFPYIREAFTLAGAFCSFALFGFLGLLLTIFFIPETKNQRLETIEAFYVKRFGGHQVESVEMKRTEPIRT